jgi:hypothetical protein
MGRSRRVVPHPVRYSLTRRSFVAIVDRLRKLEEDMAHCTSHQRLIRRAKTRLGTLQQRCQVHNSRKTVVGRVSIAVDKHLC